SPSGAEAPEVRLPRFSLPEWVTDPFPGEPDDDDVRCLVSGRYEVQRTLATSNAGAVYVARTPSGRDVVLKQARLDPWTERDGTSAQTILEKEFRVLSVLKEAGVAPEPLELFQERGQLYLAQEVIQGLRLRNYR